MITFLTFGEAQIIGGIVPNLIAFTLFLGAIGYFALTGKMAEMFGWKNKEKSTAIEVTAGVGKRLQIFSALVLQLLGGGLFLKHVFV